MNSIPTPPPPGIDITTAAPPRIYDYWLGGHNHFASDRIAALQVTEAAAEPGLVQVPRWRPDGPAPDGAGQVCLVGGVGRKAG